jgi:hypothetical protein
MAFQWIEMRIGEESDRRRRETEVLDRLPLAVEELEASLGECVQAFNTAFGAQSARLTRDGARLRVTSGGESVVVAVSEELPGFQIERNGSAAAIRIGVLPGDRLFYLDVSVDQYLGMEDLTRRILDRVLFPKLKE